ncbi:3-hydroxyacyl-CoA dehydrogenase family protein [Nocardia vinacea]|uniref:3-hydroxyacyl-CoA dehydrogenase family protein n=1 Tax=Nocardia vinacea TaxID=96468 RepID=UPI00030A021F|nr:3-hydroxyacyl-CoA dehydrogenase family protein [Nocardia vinacea]
MNHSPVQTVGVIGGGTMGAGIAYVFAEAGCHTVVIADSDQSRADHARETIVSRADKLRNQSRLESESVERIRSVVSTVGSVDHLPVDLDLIIEAVPESLDLKLDVLAAAERREPVMLATNTSALSISRLASGLQRPSNLIGLHFFNPVWTMPLLEIICGTATSDDVVTTAREIGDYLNKETIIVRDVPGFATSRLGLALGLEAIRMLEDNVASAADIDRAMELGYRHPMGPLRLTDLVGLDVRLDIAEQLSASLGPRFAPPQLLIDKVAAGELGKKSGRGFFDWSRR